MRVSHRDREARAREHEHVVGHVSDRRDLVRGDLVTLRQELDHGALVRLRVSDVEVVRLRSRRGDVLAELARARRLGGRDRVEVVADADDLRDARRRGRRSSRRRSGSNWTVCVSRATCGPSGSRMYQSAPRYTQTEARTTRGARSPARRDRRRMACSSITSIPGSTTRPPLKRRERRLEARAARRASTCRAAAGRS